MGNRKFTYETDLDGNSATNQFSVLTSKFGDGYEQNTSVGINNKKGQWAYQRTAYLVEIEAIEQFFNEHKGADSFLWDHPNDGEVRVKTDTQYQKVCLGGDAWRISTTFHQSFEP